MTAKMLPASLLATLDPVQIELLLDAFQSTVTVLRVRMEAARYSAAHRASQKARAKAARAARTHNAAERAVIIWRHARRGLKDGEIASRLGISIRTVQRALSRLPAAESLAR